MPYTFGDPSAQKLSSQTYEPIYSRSGELLIGGTLETWDQVPTVDLGPFVIGDIVKVNGQLVLYTGAKHGWQVPDAHHPITGQPLEVTTP